MNVLLIDNNPLLQKTLQYFLHPYTPSIYSIGSQEELPQKIDIIFLDSEQKDNEYVSHLKEKKGTPPIVLLSRDEKTLKELASQYPASLKKPIQYNQLQEVIHHLIPETRSFKASPYLKFYENTSAPEEQSIALSEQEPTAKKQQAATTEEPLKSIPLTPDENLESSESTNNSNPTDKQQPAFDKKQAIVIPDDIKLVDSTDSTNLHNTNTFLKKVSENMKKSHSPSKPSEPLKDLKQLKIPPETPENVDEKGIKESIDIGLPQESHSETPVDEITEEPTGSQILQPTSETPTELKNENDLENPAVISDTPDIENPQSLSTSSDFTSTEKWDTLSDKILEIIDKHFQSKWETFINTQLKKDLKEMIHKEVTQVFKEQMKDILTTEGIQSIKKASEEISWKVIPELSKQIIQTEIKKLLDKPPSK